MQKLLSIYLFSVLQILRDVWGGSRGWYVAGQHVQYSTFSEPTGATCGVGEGGGTYI